MSIGSILSESRIFDEGLHVEAGYAFLTKKDFAKEPFNPPLAREITALPSFFFPETLSDPLYFWQRTIVVLLSSIFLILVYMIIRKLFGTFSAMFGVLLYAFNPEILAHSHYAATDLILSLFVFLSIMLLLLWKESLTKKKSATIGICIGLALSAKVSAVPFLFLSFGLIFMVDVITKKKLKDYFTQKFLFNFITTVVICLLTLWSTYFFTQESIMGEGFNPRNPVVKLLTSVPGVEYVLSEPVPLGGYLRTIKQVLLYNYSDVYSKPAFLLGTISPHGWWYFYPIAFILKTPIPFLLIISISIFFYRKYTCNTIFLAVFAIFVSAMLSTLNLGIRYILPAYPLLIVYVSQIVGSKIHFSHKKSILIVLLAWYITGTLQTYPHTLSYMNEFAGAINTRYKVLLDSNYDWGQGLVDLASYQKKYVVQNLQLAYFGMIDPKLYDLSYERLGDLSLGDKTKHTRLQTTKGYTTAISASCFYFCGYYKQPLFSNKKPTIVGGSILVFTW